MGRAVTVGFLRWAPWAIAAAAGLFTLWALLAQIETQAGLNAAMQGVRQNVSQARELTAGTAATLAPLAATADTLAAMNKRLAATAADIREMNASMQRVTVKQEAILAHLGSLNGRMTEVNASLAAVDGKNKALLATNKAMTDMTHSQADSLDALSNLTGGATTYLQRLNRKFAFLRNL